MMSLEQTIEHVERAYKESRNGLQYALKRGETKFAERCKKDAEEYGQFAAWLRELAERRKAPEIIRCGECRWYGRANKQRFYRGMDCLQRRISTIDPDKDFCSKAERAERRTDD